MANQRKSRTVALSSLSALDRYMASQPDVLAEPPPNSFRAAEYAVRTGTTVDNAVRHLNRQYACGKLGRVAVRSNKSSPIYYYTLVK